MQQNHISSPGLFGISGKSNRDTTKRSHWGKNEFNSSFPASLLCFMNKKNVNPIYLKLDNDLKVIHQEISVNSLFEMNPDDDNIYFSFEDSFAPYQSFIRGQLPRSDLVILDNSDLKSPWRRSLEIKLTALPDNTTYQLSEDHFSCEMVFRPTAIVHLALSISYSFRAKRDDLLDILSEAVSDIFNWRSKEEVVEKTVNFISSLNKSFLQLLDRQEPFIIQPIWKTKGKRSILEDNCLDVFVWSNFAFTRLFIDPASNINNPKKRITRQQRCIFWLVRMLYDFALSGSLNPTLITSEMAYELQTDKAFAISGTKSWNYLKSDQLTKPRIHRSEIKNIILNGGHMLLSPERRFDAAIVNTPELF